MANSTTFLTIPAMQLLGTQLVYAEKYVDFTLEPTVAAGTLDVLKLPKGCLPLVAGFTSVTHQDTVTFALSVPTKAITLLGATAQSADDEVDLAVAGTFTSQLLDADDTMRVTIGAATAATAKVIFFAVYAVSDAAR